MSRMRSSIDLVPAAPGPGSSRVSSWWSLLLPAHLLDSSLQPLTEGRLLHAPIQDDGRRAQGYPQGQQLLKSATPVDPAQPRRRTRQPGSGICPPG